MEPNLNQLKGLLTEEITLHEALKTYLEEEAEQDGKNDGAKLLHLQQQKHQAVQEIQKKERARAKLVETIAAAWGEETAGLTLRRIAAKAPPPLDAELEQCHAGLLALVTEIQSLAHHTGANAQARLKAIDATLAVIHEAARMHPTYSDKGRLQKMTPTLKQTSV